ncbi:MAG: hypothetical protein K6G32_04895 [Prevotella sp.]|nr:hypothetical protein [Prevotella sp.]
MILQPLQDVSRAIPKPRAMPWASCSGGGQYNEMRQRLVALNELNRADSVLTAMERDEAQTLTDYFDSHGTPNDQMLTTTFWAAVTLTCTRIPWLCGRAFPTSET